MFVRGFARPAVVYYIQAVRRNNTYRADYVTIKNAYSRSRVFLLLRTRTPKHEADFGRLEKLGRLT